MRSICAAVVAAATVVLLAVPAAARAASIAYVGADGNVHLSSPDGSATRQVTRDATATLRYDFPSQADDGTIVAVSEGTTAADGIKFAFFLRPDGTLIESQPLPAPAGTVRIPALTGAQVSPDGGMVVYDWAQAAFGGRANYAMSIIGRIQSTDACGIFCAYGWVAPRWSTGGRALAVDAYLGADGVGVQSSPSAAPAPWFNFTEAGISSIDEAAGRLVAEGVDPAVGSVIDVANDRPPTTLVLLRYSGAPGSSLPVMDCQLEDYTKIPGYARLSPDGSMLAWQDTAGVYVSPVPTQTGGGTCTLQPRLIAPGGSRPDWGPADVPAAAAVPETPATPGTPSPPPPAPPGTPTTRPGSPVVTTPRPVSSSCKKARKAVTTAQRRVTKARKAVRSAQRAAARKRSPAARRSLAKARKTLKSAERKLKSQRRLATRRCR